MTTEKLMFDVEEPAEGCRILSYADVVFEFGRSVVRDAVEAEGTVIWHGDIAISLRKDDR